MSTSPDLQTTRDTLRSSLSVSQRRIVELEARIAQLESRLAQCETRVDRIFLSRIWNALVSSGNLLLRLRGIRSPEQAPDAKSGDAGEVDRYHRWITQYERVEPAWVQARMAAFEFEPLFSVVVPPREEAVELRATTLRSLAGQSYPKWELATRHDELVSGDYAVFVEPGDELSRDALFHLAEAVNNEPAADLIYSDEDVIDAKGVRRDPFFKPDWSPRLLQSLNYLAPLLACKRELLHTCATSMVSLPRDNATCIQMASVAQHIVHVPHVLCHVHDGAGASAIDLSDAVRGAEEAPRSGRDEPEVAVLIPSCNASRLCSAVNSLIAGTAYKNYKVVAIDNSRDDEIRQFSDRHRLMYEDCRGLPFNFSHLINRTAKRLTSELLLLLNDDVTVTDPEWLAALVEPMEERDVGAAGARLLYPDGRIQHAGVVVGIHGTCDHAFRGLPAAGDRYRGFETLAREVSAVTGACLLTRRAAFEELGGLDEKTFPIGFQDIDYCLRLRQSGRRILYSPRATLHHHESASMMEHGIKASPDELLAFRKRWAAVIAHDPYYNPNLTRERTDFSLDA
jgi:GT2 family glycosyltransferase